MAIVRMKKFHLLAHKADKDKLLRNLQIFRNVQFSQVDSDNEAISEVKYQDELTEIEQKLSFCKYALDHMSKYYPKSSGLKEMYIGLPNLTFEELEARAENIDFDSIYNSIRANGDGMDGTRYDLSKVREELEELNAYKKLDIIPSTLDSLSTSNYNIGSIPIKTKKEFEEALAGVQTVYYEVVGIKKDEAIYIIFNHKDDNHKVDEIFKSKGFSKNNLKLTSTVSERINELRDYEKRLINRKDDLREGLKDLIKYRQDIEICYEYYSNKKVRLLANEKAKGSSAVCIFEGYIPESQLEEFKQIVTKSTDGANSLEFEDVDRESEEVPIMLKNNKLVRPFEIITENYSVPKYNELDPTALLAPFYAFFFGMMTADAGYGTLVFILCILAIKFFNLNPTMKKSIKFFATISIFTIIWGIIYNSYFGTKIPWMPQLLDMESQVVNILILCIIIAIIHLFLGLGVRGYLYIKNKKYIMVIFDVISWYMAILGAIFLMAGDTIGLSSAAVQISKWVMIAGMIMIIIGGMLSTTGSFGAKLGAGIYNLYGISGYIGDIVSYTRLMALGLSGAYIALSANIIAGMMFGSFIGKIFGIIVLIVFHAFNLFLSYLGSYVHGMRLIYVEFFGKFYEGGGKPFKSFRSPSKYINLDRHYEE